MADVQPDTATHPAWQKVQAYESAHALCWFWMFEPPYKSACGKCSKCREAHIREQVSTTKGDRA